VHFALIGHTLQRGFTALGETYPVGAFQRGLGWFLTDFSDRPTREKWTVGNKTGRRLQRYIGESAFMKIESSCVGTQGGTGRKLSVITTNNNPFIMVELGLFKQMGM
jgi:hypothetical protein